MFSFLQEALVAIGEHDGDFRNHSNILGKSLDP